MSDILRQAEDLRDTLAHKAEWHDESQIVKELIDEIKRLEDALVEERARRICHLPREDKVGHWPRYEDLVVEEAREQLRAEGVIG